MCKGPEAGNGREFGGHKGSPGVAGTRGGWAAGGWKSALRSLRCGGGGKIMCVGGTFPAPLQKEDGPSDW